MLEPQFWFPEIELLTTLSLNVIKYLNPVCLPIFEIVIRPVSVGSKLMSQSPVILRHVSRVGDDAILLILRSLTDGCLMVGVTGED